MSDSASRCATFAESTSRTASRLLSRSSTSVSRPRLWVRRGAIGQQRRSRKMKERQIATHLIFHEVDDVEHWLHPPKREEVFGPLGSTVRRFHDPQGSNRIGLIAEIGHERVRRVHPVRDGGGGDEARRRSAGNHLGSERQLAHHHRPPAGAGGRALSRTFAPSVATAPVANRRPPGNGSRLGARGPGPCQPGCGTKTTPSAPEPVDSQIASTRTGVHAMTVKSLRRHKGPVEQPSGLWQRGRCPPGSSSAVSRRTLQITR